MFVVFVVLCFVTVEKLTKSIDIGYDCLLRMFDTFGKKNKLNLWKYENDCTVSHDAVHFDTTQD